MSINVRHLALVGLGLTGATVAATYAALPRLRDKIDAGETTPGGAMRSRAGLVPGTMVGGAFMGVTGMFALGAIAGNSQFPAGGGVRTALTAVAALGAGMAIGAVIHSNELASTAKNTAHRIMLDHDANGDDTIDMQGGAAGHGETVSIAKSSVGAAYLYAHKEIRALAKAGDANGDQSLSRAELLSFLEAQDAAGNHDGRIQLRELKSVGWDSYGPPADWANTPR